MSLDTFVPAFRDRIAIRAGANSMLQINLATLFSSIQLNPTVPVGAMSSDWKWVLRSSPATRPVTRFMPDDSEDQKSEAVLHPHLFSGTHLLVGISGGDAGLVDSDSTTFDVGTEFALSTNLYGKSGLQLAGRVGQPSDIGPNVFAICAIYSPRAKFGLANPPEVALAVSQVRMVPAIQGSQESALMMRSMSLSMYESADPTDNLHLEYGMVGESVDFLQHSARVSPFARATVDLGWLGSFIAAYSDGGRPDELTTHAVSKNPEPENLLDDDLSAPVNALARTPQISVRNDRLELQRTQNLEAGFTKAVGNTTLSFSTFYEDVSNGRMNVAGDLSRLESGSLLSDGISKTSTYNIGNYSRDGYVGSLDQRIDNELSFQLAYGRMGAFTAGDSLMPGTNSKDDFLSRKNHNMASFGVRRKLPKAGYAHFSPVWMVRSARVDSRPYFYNSEHRIGHGIERCHSPAAAQFLQHGRPPGVDG